MAVLSKDSMSVLDFLVSLITYMANYVLNYYKFELLWLLFAGLCINS